MSDQMVIDDDDDFNVIQPTLLQQLKTILDQYPDDGQILKELIQNAEDAGATEVKFLYDKHSYGAEKLYSESLAKFQGPALYAYNDAQFTSDDWEGIRKIYDSNKVKDPMKVGRFGLGFKSVFHLTDLPSILSNSQIGFIDPHEVHFGHSRTGFIWRLSKHKEKMDEIPDQFRPFKGVFDCNDDVFIQGCYKGTIFRFPLRDSNSDLSQTLYSDEKMQSLFNSFIADAHLVLLFLRNLESIKVYTREKSESRPKEVFHAKITDDSLHMVREKRMEFHAKILQNKHLQEPVSVTYPITIETERDRSVQRQSFLVTTYCCGVNVSADFGKLLADKELSYLPSVGVAMALPLRRDLPAPPIEGHVFCALPLPVQTKSMTGLPVHVNGFFALNQNRHYIKTPNADQDDRDKLADKKQLLWNRCLMEEAVPKAYVMMIREAISAEVQPEAVYKAWPNLNNIDKAWLSVQKPLLELLVCEKVIATRCHKWLKVEQAIFDSLDETEPRELLLKALLDSHNSVASLPRHVLKSIKCYKPAIREITPPLMRQVLKGSRSCYCSLNRLEKLRLLKYILKCEDFTELIGLELLPTASGIFKSFSGSGEYIYICSREHPLTFLQGMKTQLLDPDIDNNLLKVLQKVADQGCTQLQRLCNDDVPSLLWKSLPSNWLNVDKVEWFPGDETLNHPTKDWLTCLWEYLRDQFKDDLSKFENLPLIPLDLSEVPIILTRLANQSKVVVRRLKNDHLDQTVCEILRHLGVIVMKECPTFLLSHPAVLGMFVHPPRVHSVLKAMEASSSSMGNGMHSAIVLDNVADESKRSLRKFIATASSLTREEKDYLLYLPIFETLSKVFVSKKQGLGAAPDITLPVTPNGDLIDVKGDDSKKLAGLLDIKIPTLTEFVCENILPDVRGKCYSEEDIDKLMTFVIERYNIHNEADARFEEEMKSLPFVPTNSKRVKAKSLFDPRKNLLQNIFADEDVFPVREPYSNPEFLVVLEKLGMKSEKKNYCP